MILLIKVQIRLKLIPQMVMILRHQTLSKKLGETVWRLIILRMSTTPFLINTR